MKTKISKIEALTRIDEIEKKKKEIDKNFESYGKDFKDGSLKNFEEYEKALKDMYESVRCKVLPIRPSEAPQITLLTIKDFYNLTKYFIKNTKGIIQGMLLDAEQYKLKKYLKT